MSVYEGAESLGARNDPRYDEAVAHVQAGEWAAAIANLEGLAADFPGEAWIRVRLEDARMKAALDKKTRVRPRRGSTVHWRPIIVRVLLVVAVAALAWLIVTVLRPSVSAYFQARQFDAETVALYRQGAAFLSAARDAAPADAAGLLADAEMRFNAVLARETGHPEATAGLAAIPPLRTQNATCLEAKRLFAGQAPDDWRRARALFGELNAARPGFCDASAAIEEINRRFSRLDLETLAGAAYDAGDCVAAIGHYLALRTADSAYQRAAVDERLFTCYVRLGKAIVDGTPPALERLAEALGYFEQALTIRPRDADAVAEQRLASLFLAGRKASEEGRLDEAARRWEAMVQERPAYLGGIVPPLLYDAYIRLGDNANAAGDCGLGYDYYSRAARLPGVDPASALARQEVARACLTPTPTPRPTATPAPTRPPTAPPPTAPPPPLTRFRGQIVFRAERDGALAYWAMNPDGSGKRYIGASPALDKEYAALYAKETYSPDGRCRVYASKDSARGDQAAQIYRECQEGGGKVSITKLTFFAKVSYDPVWSPAGDRIAFVSQDRAGDDIWVLELWSNGQLWNYTPNDWEWDKHPTWSADGRKLAFWSNREGTPQIYVMDANGQNIQKISGDAPWPEYDPLWIK